MNSSCYKKNAVRFLLLLVVMVCIGNLCGCAAKTPPPVEDTSDHYFKDLASAAQYLSGSISGNLSRETAVQQPKLVVDVFFNEQSSEVSVDGRNIQKVLIDSFGAGTPAYPAAPLGSKSLQKANWVVTGTFSLQQQKTAATGEKWIKIMAMAQDIRTGTILAQPVAFVDSRQFKVDPIRFYKDAPMYMTADRQRVKTGAVGQPSTAFGDTMQIKAVLADAREAYESGDFAAAEKLFGEVLKLSNNKNILALSGIYQSQINTNRLDEAEKSFAKLVEAGLDSGSLSVKFLFKVGTTDFLTSGNLAQQYPIWIRQIASQLHSKKQCLSINGHASRSGTAELNERLSLQRAERIVTLLKKSKAGLNSQLRAFGKGFSENIVGSGTNDALDAIDRRVNFDVVQCK